MIPEGIWKWAQLKGITVAGTGDFTHPRWFRELENKLEPAREGLFQLKKAYKNCDSVPRSCASDMFFLLSAEVSCIYRKNGRTRKIHCLILVPDLVQAANISALLSKVGDVTSDGRPILGLDAKDLLKITLDVSPEGVFIPAHAWTPHFSVFGAASGFDSLEECFEELTPQIHAIETGLSSDPPMNRRLSALDRLTLISNSDAHSPAKMGREANIFETDLSYGAISRAVKTGRGFLGTIEFFPAEGKYHYDGHRSCGVRYEPSQTMSRNGICPVCGKPLTIGVAHRVEALADRDAAAIPAVVPNYRSVVPLIEIIAEARGRGPASKGVQQEYVRLLTNLGSEFAVLLEVPLAEIERASSPRLAEALKTMREGSVQIVPGYDGEYGKIRLF